jgi:hypothetical protein
MWRELSRSLLETPVLALSVADTTPTDATMMMSRIVMQRYIETSIGDAYHIVRIEQRVRILWSWCASRVWEECRSRRQWGIQTHHDRDPMNWPNSEIYRDNYYTTGGVCYTRHWSPLVIFPWGGNSQHSECIRTRRRGEDSSSHLFTDSRGP